MKSQSTEQPRWPSYMLLAAVACGLALLRVGDWQIRLAMVSGDDSMEAVAVYFARANEFTADAYISAWAPIAMASAASWIPALAYKYLAIHPRLFFEAFTIGQHVGLALAMFHFSFTVSRSQLLAWLTAAVTIAWNPQFWNLALIGGLEWMPYANWIALPFLVYAFDTAYRGLRLRCYVSLLAGTLIHPIMGMLATAIVAAFMVYEALAARDLRRALEAIAASIIIAALAAVPVWLSTRGIAFADEDPVSGLLANQHVRPWGASYGTWSMLSSAMCIASLVGLADTKNRFFLVALVMTCAMTAAHFLAVMLSIPQVMSIIASRSTILLVLISMPFMVATFWRAIQSRDPARVLAVVLTLFRTNAVTLLAATLAVRGGRIGAVVGAGLAAVVVASQLTPWHSLSLGSGAPWLLGYGNLVSFSWIALAIGAIGALLVAQLRAAAGTALIVTAIFASTALGAHRTGRQLGSTMYADYAAAQIWARDRTPPGSTFTLLRPVPEMSWRSLSERPVVAAAGVGTAYRQAQHAADYNDRLTVFFAKIGKTYEGKPANDLDEAYWRAFSEEFGADYLVVPAAWPALGFTEAYRNPSFRIYRIAPPPSMASGQARPIH
ncbi:hypothetical protein ACVWXN_003455 [Bradyrhizobium sp. i1.4.4]